MRAVAAAGNLLSSTVVIDAAARGFAEARGELESLRAVVRRAGERS